MPLHETSLAESRPPLRESRLGNRRHSVVVPLLKRRGRRNHRRIRRPSLRPSDESRAGFNVGGTHAYRDPYTRSEDDLEKGAEPAGLGGLSPKRKWGMRVRKAGRPAMDDGAREAARRPIATKVWSQIEPGPYNKASSAGPRGEPDGSEHRVRRRARGPRRSSALAAAARTRGEHRRTCSAVVTARANSLDTIRAMLPRARRRASRSACPPPQDRARRQDTGRCGRRCP